AGPPDLVRRPDHLRHRRRLPLGTRRRGLGPGRRLLRNPPALVERGPPRDRGPPPRPWLRDLHAGRGALPDVAAVVDLHVVRVRGAAREAAVDHLVAFAGLPEV